MTIIVRSLKYLGLQYILYRSCLPIYGIAIIRLLSFLFLDDFEGNTNISVAIKSGSTVIIYLHALKALEELFMNLRRAVQGVLRIRLILSHFRAKK